MQCNDCCTLLRRLLLHILFAAMVNGGASASALKERLGKSLNEWGEGRRCRRDSGHHVEEEETLQTASDRMSASLLFTYLTFSVHEPSVPEVAAKIASVVPVGPPLAPRTLIRLIDRVLDNA